MVNLTFGEQVKIILSRKGMTIKELAEQVEQYTGKNMSRQNMTQRLGRDNFQEQDMRMIAEILGCSFQLSIMEQLEDAPKAVVKEPVMKESTVKEAAAKEPAVKEPAAVKEAAVQEPAAEDITATERDITVGELVQMEEESIPAQEGQEEKKAGFAGIRGFVRKPKFRTVEVSDSQTDGEETPKEPILGEMNPYTGKEYQTNSVRMHPKRIGYVQVYDQEQHKWTDMTEWAFLGYQERKKALLGKDYEPPIYLD